MTREKRVGKNYTKKGKKREREREKELLCFYLPDQTITAVSRVRKRERERGANRLVSLSLSSIIAVLGYHGDRLQADSRQLMLLGGEDPQLTTHTHK